MNSFEDLTKRIEDGGRVYYTEFLTELGFDTSCLPEVKACWYWDKDGFHEYDTSPSLDLGQEVYIVIDHCGPNLMSDQDTISIPSVCYSEKEAWQSIELVLNNFISGKDGDPYISELTTIPNPIIQIYPGLKAVIVKIPILCGCNGSVISRHHFYKIVKKSITTF